MFTFAVVEKVAFVIGEEVVLVKFKCTCCMVKFVVDGEEAIKLKCCIMCMMCVKSIAVVDLLVLTLDEAVQVCVPVQTSEVQAACVCCCVVECEVVVSIESVVLLASEIFVVIEASVVDQLIEKLVLCICCCMVVKVEQAVEQAIFEFIEVLACLVVGEGILFAEFVVFAEVSEAFAADLVPCLYCCGCKFKVPAEVEKVVVVVVVVWNVVVIVELVIVVDVFAQDVMILEVALVDVEFVDACFGCRCCIVVKCMLKVKVVKKGVLEDLIEMIVDALIDVVEFQDAEQFVLEKFKCGCKKLAKVKVVEQYVDAEVQADLGVEVNDVVVVNADVVVIDGVVFVEGEDGICFNCCQYKCNDECNECKDECNNDCCNCQCDCK